MQINNSSAELAAHVLKCPAEEGGRTNFVLSRVDFSLLISHLHVRAIVGYSRYVCCVVLHIDFLYRILPAHRSTVSWAEKIYK